MAKNSAAAAARTRGKAVLAVGAPPYGGPKGVGTIPKPKVAGPPAKPPPIKGPMSGLRGTKKVK